MTSTEVVVALRGFCAGKSTEDIPYAIASLLGAVFVQSWDRYPKTKEDITNFVDAMSDSAKAIGNLANVVESFNSITQ